MANVLIEEQTMSDIADAIREKNGTSNTYLPADMPQAVKDIEDTGVGSRQWWEDVCTNKTSFSYMFSGCKNLTTIPQLDTSNGTDFSYMFSVCKNLTTIPQLDTSKGTAFGAMFRNCSNLTTIPQLDTSQGTNFHSMFASCSNLTTIPQLDTSKGTNLDYMFNYCYMLTTVSFALFSIKKSISFAYSPLLTDESIQSIIDGLADLTGQKSKILTLSKTLEEKITDEQKAYVVSKNWQLAFS